MTQPAEVVQHRLQEKPIAAPSKKTEPEKTTFQSFRELVETLAIALFLSILFKFFAAEAYVIPTGSMAPTLMGRHKDIVCPECGFAYQVNASEEMDNERNIPNGVHVAAGTCPECGYTLRFDEHHRSYKGDRVIVNKCIPEMRETRRWDVSVFRCPADPKNNYIKRIVGLPNEEVRIQYGDLFVRTLNADGTKGEFQIARKPLDYLLPMLQTVDDNDCRPKRLLERGWPSRWQDELSLAENQAGWLSADGGSKFYFAGSPVPKPNEPASYPLASLPVPKADPSGLVWLRYRHIVPSSDDWNALQTESILGGWLQEGKIRNNPQLVTDLTAYNTGLTTSGTASSAERLGFYPKKSFNGFGFNWTGDLAVSCRMAFGAFADDEEIVLELVKGGTRFQAHLYPARGEAILTIPSVAEYQPETAPIAIRPNKTCSVMFLNIDEQMRLVIDGTEIVFPNEGRYDYLCQPQSDGMPGVLPRNRDPNINDLQPAAIGAKSGPVEISHLKIQRDIYYIAMGDDHIEPVEAVLSRTADGGRLTSMRMNKRCDRFFTGEAPSPDEDSLTAFYSTPSRWRGYGNTKSALFAQGEDSFLALGDNSGLSQDSRLWGEHQEGIPHYVSRDLMLGKAICVFWPHGKAVPGTNLLLIPNIAKMRGIN